VATIVVVQSDTLAVWTGLVGALGGVALGASIDSLRTRAAERKRTRTELLRGGSEALAHAAAYVRASQASERAKDEAAWVEVIDARQAALQAALMTIRVIGNNDLYKAAIWVVAAFLEPMPSGEDEGAVERRMDEANSRLREFKDLVQAAKL
jgi:hypothetical protein